MKKLANTLIAAFIAAAMVFTLTPLVGGFAFANGGEGDIDLGDYAIAFDGDCDYGWSYIYPVDDDGKTVNQSDLNITVVDEDGHPADTSKYDLEFYRTWYDEVNDQERREAVTSPFRIVDADLNANGGEGFTEYEVTATAKDNSGYSGEVSATFYIADCHSLNWICANRQFVNCAYSGGWRQADRFWVTLDDLADGTIITTIDGTELEEGTDYTVTYYERTTEPSDDPQTDRDAVLTPDPAKKLTGAPTQAGGYLAVFEGKDGSGYYGGGIALLDVENFITDYDLPGDEDLLPEWGRYVESELSGFIGKEDFSDGDEFTTAVTNVEPDDEEVISVEKDGDDGWDLRAEKMGTATITVTYEDCRGNEQTYNYDLHVTDEVYEMNMWIVDGSSMALPGSSHALQATAEKKYLDDEGEEQSTTEGLTIKWSVPEGGEYVAAVNRTETLSENRPDSVTVTFNELEEGQNTINERVAVKAAAMIKDGDDDVEVASDDRGFQVTDEYYEVWPAGLNPGMEVGESVEVTPELRHYALTINNAEKYETVDNVDFRWTDYNDQTLDISNPDANGKYTITRMSGWGTGLRLEASCNEGYFNQSYWFFDQDCWIWFQSPTEFDDEGDVVYDDGTFTYTLRTEGISDNADITYTVLRGNGDPLPDGCCKVDEDDWTFTLNGEALADNGIAFVKLRAEARVNGNIICSTYDVDDDDDWHWCSVRESWVDYGEYDRDMLPGEDDSIDGYNTMTVANSEHPFEDDFDYEVTGVEVTGGAELIDDDCLEETDGSVFIKKDEDDDSDDFWYYFRVKDLEELGDTELGDVKFKVAYKLTDDPDVTGTFGFTAHVKRDVYGVRISSEDDAWRALPGKSITLVARGWHENVETGYTEEGLDYQWSLEGNNSVAEITQDQQHPERATVTFKDKPDNYQDYYSEGVDAIVKLFDGENEVASDNKYLEACEEYFQIEPAQINGALDVGGSLDITPRLLRYSLDINNADGYEVVDNIDFNWDCYNDEVLEITGPDEGGKYTIERLKDWDTDLRLTAEWSYGDYNDHEEQWYYFENKNYELWLDSETDTVYSDGDLELTINADEELNNYDVPVTVGIWDGEAGEDGDWDTVFAEGTEYDVNGDTITLHGGALFAAGNEEDYGIRVLVQLKEKDGDAVYGDDDRWIEVREVREDYDLEDNRAILPGWDGYIDSEGRVYVENSQYPEGKDFTFTITDVALDNNQNDQNEDILELNQDGGNGWNYQALHHGTATINVTYEKLDGSTAHHSFNVDVTDVVYGVDLDVADGGSKKALPGGSIELVASGWKDVEGEGRTSEGLTYEWDMDGWAKNFAELTVDDNDPSKATVTFDEDIDGWNDFSVWVEIYEDDDFVAQQDIGLTVSDDYCEIWPTQIESPDPGKTVEVTPEVRAYAVDIDNYETIDNVEYDWDYDQNVLKIEEKEGADGTFTIKRLTTDNTNVQLIARWKDHGDQSTDTWYWMNLKDYQFGFDPDEYSIGSNESKTVELDVSQLGDWDYDLEFEVGKWEGENNWVDAPADVYSVNNNKVTIDAAELAQTNLGGVNIHAILSYNNEYINDAWCWIELCDHVWGEPTYVWSDDNTTVTATRVCENNDRHKETETVGTTSETSTPATCSKKGVATFTSEAFKNDAFEVQTKDVVLPIDPDAHDWGDITYTWADDYSTVTAKRPCANNHEHDMIEEVPASLTETIDSTCKEVGSKTYTSAAFTNPLFKVQTKVVEIPKKEQHTWDEGVVTKDPTCMTKGEKTFTCGVCGTTKKEDIDIDPDAHDWDDGVILEGDESSCDAEGTLTFTCKHNVEHKKTAAIDKTAHTPAAAVQEKIVNPTCTTAGSYESVVYCQKCGAEISREVKSISATGHDKPLAHTAAKAVTCEADGNSEYWYCSKCNQYFGDANGQSIIAVNSWIIPKTGHEWDEGKITKEPTCTESGVRTFTCSHDATHTYTADVPALNHSLKKVDRVEPTVEQEGTEEYWICERDYCGKMFSDAAGQNEITAPVKIDKLPDPVKKMGADGTALGKGASKQAAAKAITSMKSDSDPAGAVFAALNLRSTKQAKTSITLNWAKANGAVSYVIYGNLCGKANKMTELATVKTNTYTVKKAVKKLAKGKYYKFIVVALDKDDNVVSTSKVIHVATSGAKAGNYKSVTITKKVIKAAAKLKKGKTLKLGAKLVPVAKKKVAKHCGLRYESTNKAIATVSSKGVVKGIKKGTCFVYAYAQNGVFKKIKVVVK